MTWQTLPTFVSELSEWASNRSLDFKSLGEFIAQYTWQEIDYASSIPEVESLTNYSRNILQLQPIECVLLHWPPGVASAVHEHQGFYGYVIVLEGMCDNVEYAYDGATLHESKSMRGLPGGVLPEEDGVIHKLVNPSPTDRALTLHIYYPPLETFEGMRIFDLDNQRLGELSARAEKSSWDQPASAFSSIEESAFVYRSFAEHKAVSHRIIPVLPKPPAAVIQEMLRTYYCEQATTYDHFDTQHDTRNRYTQFLNELIATDLGTDGSTERMLTLACGTGRRATDIREQSGLPYTITGVDLSPTMCQEAQKRGLHVHCGQWLECELDGEEGYDVATFLYAFGHIPTAEERLQSLIKIHEHLNEGGCMYLDVFNVHDRTEWGPHALRAYQNNQLGHFGYDPGDVFYQKTDGEAIAYLHYFSEKEICALLEQAGFEVCFVKYIGYVSKPGELLQGPDEGTLFVKAKKSRKV